MKNKKSSKTNKIPLIVDLDNTLINTDLLQKSLLGALKNNPFLLLLLPFWLIQGLAYSKTKLTQHFTIDPHTLPYNQVVIDYIKRRKKQGDKIILATASAKDYAFLVAKHLQLFDAVMASSQDFNLTSEGKAQKLIERFGKKNFDYIGDHNRDLPVWQAANLSILVNVSAKIIKKTKHLNRLIL